MSGKTILVVEDEGIIGMGVKLTLLKMGYEVLDIPTTGEGAIELADRFRPDLAILDITLDSEIDGIEVAEHISAKHKIPVIYMTAHTDEETLDRARRTSHHGFLFKPYEEDELRAIVESAIGS